MLAEQTPGPSVNVGEFVAGSIMTGSFVGHWVGYLPGMFTAIGAAIGIIYYALQIWKDEVVQSRVRAWRLRKIDKYKAKILKIEQATTASKVTKT